MVLARGPVHEAYAATAEFPVAGPVVDHRHPGPIEELPPDQRPAGENVQWIPGYWGWDEERTDFIWVSGLSPWNGRAKVLEIRVRWRVFCHAQVRRLNSTGPVVDPRAGPPAAGRLDYKAVDTGDDSVA